MRHFTLNSQNRSLSIQSVCLGTLRRFLVLSLLGLLLGTTSVWATNYSSNGWAFTINLDGTATVINPVTYVGGIGGGYFDRAESNLVIPPEVTLQNIAANGNDSVYIISFGDTYTVTGIDFGVFLSNAQRTAMIGISYPNTVTTIKNIANCPNLQSIAIPSSVTTISTYAFQSDSSLLSITIPATVTSIGDYVCRNCTSLQSATVLNSKIGDGQFLNCTVLKDVTLSDDVTTIGRDAFLN